MPQYELMYLLSSSVADDEVPKISQQVLKFMEDLGATDVRETHLGKKKLSFPIKKTRNGYYVVVNFAMDSKNVNALEAKIRTQDSTIIRHLLINLDEHLERLAKDKVAQEKLSKRTPPAGQETPQAAAKPEAAKPEKSAEKAEKAKTAEPAQEQPALELDSDELDKKIEEALSEDLTK